MKTKEIYTSLFLSLVLVNTCPVTMGQTMYSQIGESYMTIAGTSTLHNWTMTSLVPQLQATFETNADGTIKKVKALSLKVESESLKSAHKAMDKNAYASLKTGQHKLIVFNLTSADVKQDGIQCLGNLTIAGVTREIGIDAVCHAKPNGTFSLLCTGNKSIKMSDYQVEAPTFMFGTVKTGDDITISFNMQLAPIR